jgi:hypothetical protein
MVAYSATTHTWQAYQLSQGLNMYQPLQQVRYQGALATIIDTLPSVIGYDYLINYGGIHKPVKYTELTEV